MPDDLLPRPRLDGADRAAAALAYRCDIADRARARPRVDTVTNGEEADFAPRLPTSFTKGLLHTADGLLADIADYACLTAAINEPDASAFARVAAPAPATFRCRPAGGGETAWRGWESPRAGHAFDPQGPDAGAVGMAPAPRVGSSELAAEMAEVYALALLRDVPFETIRRGGAERLIGAEPAAGPAELAAADAVAALGEMPFYRGSGVVSSTPGEVARDGLNPFERARRDARFPGQVPAPLTTESAFRGSTPGAMVGPYVSQFLLIGTRSRAAGVGGGADFELADGRIGYGSLTIDQRTLTHRGGLDHMTRWDSWLDVQNGADYRGLDGWEREPRFITTPRDLATYVHVDQLHQAYLNAALIMLELGVPTSSGFPEPGAGTPPRRTGFATFGGPHILSLVTEVATRCLKAVRRQKFNFHRRARPEALGGRLTLAALGLGERLGAAADAFAATLDEIPPVVRASVVAHNAKQNSAERVAARGVRCAQPGAPRGVTVEELARHNLLVPMAFVEGSPMHPAYGAGHATVAGGCVTMLKAFFEMFDGERPRPLTGPGGTAIDYVPDADGRALRPAGTAEPLTVQGELDKLAANISIGRNMAGVHYYSDYYDSLRLGERVAVGILLDQAGSYGEAVETRFDSFDRDRIVVRGDAGGGADLEITAAHGGTVPEDDWWRRHVPAV